MMTVYISLGEWWMWTRIALIRKVRTNYSIWTGRMASMSHRIQLIVVLMTMIYWSERIPNTIRKGKECMGKIQGDQAKASRGPLPVEPHSMCLMLPTLQYDNTCECWNQRGSSETQHPGFLLGTPSTQQIPKSRLPGGKYVFTINHIVYTNSSDRVRHSYQLMVRALLKPNVPDTRQGSN